MDKLKKNAGLKRAAAIVLSVSFVSFIISGILGTYFLYKDAYSGGLDSLYDNMVDDVTEVYENEAIAYYEHTIIAGLSGDEDYYSDVIAEYEEMFSRENCNYSFKIEPVVSTEKNTFPVLSNFTYTDTELRENKKVKAEADISYDVTFTYQISTTEINRNGLAYENDEDFYAGDYVSWGIKYEPSEASEGYYVLESEYDRDINGYIGYDYAITNGSIYYKLTDDSGFWNAWWEFHNKYSDYDMSGVSFVSYDAENGIFSLDVTLEKLISITITEQLPAEFSAEDNYQNISIYTAASAVPSVFSISLGLLVICAIYLAAAAGHKKGSDGIVFGRLDRIPYDIVLALFFVGAYSFAYVIVSCAQNIFLDYTNYYDINGAIVGTAFLVVFLPAFITTTAVRIKGKERVLKNTVILRGVKFALRLIKNIAKKLAGGTAAVVRNMNLYWKYLGLLTLAALIEVLAATTESIAVMLTVGLFEYIFFCVVIIKAINNMNELKKGAKELAGGNTDYEIDTTGMMWEFYSHGENLNSIKDGMQTAVAERMKSECMKTELITNVSHDIKTPLTSIISYVDLLGKENIDNDKAKEYIGVLERQSARLKKLIQDLIDASKASTGNLTVTLEKTDLRVLLEQAMGEFADSLEKKGLRTVINYNTEPVTVMADGQHLWRIFQNVINNITKYAQENTRVYIDISAASAVVKEDGGRSKNNMIQIVFKNISKDELNLTGDELMERFVRGDSSRNTEGSGLGLSIARSLAALQGGNLEIVVDGDLFKVVLLLVRA